MPAEVTKEAFEPLSSVASGLSRFPAPLGEVERLLVPIKNLGLTLAWRRDRGVIGELPMVGTGAVASSEGETAGP